MSNRPKTILVFAAHHNRFGFAFFLDKQPMDWQLIHEAAKSSVSTKTKVQEILDYYSPDIVLTENLNGSMRKGRNTQRLILAIKETVFESNIETHEVTRTQPFANKYQQIDWLCERYPQLEVIKPKPRKSYDPEPPYITVFEAVWLGHEFLV